MKRKKGGLNILIILEVLILIVVVIVGVFTAGIHSITGLMNKQTAETELSVDEENRIDMNAPERVTEEKAEAMEEEATADGATGNEIATDSSAAYSETVTARLAEMTTEEKVAQLFLVDVDAFTEVDSTSIAGDGFRSTYEAYPIAGIVCETDNIVGRDQITDMLSDAKDIAEEVTDIPLYIAVYEQGGPVAKESPAGNFADGETLHYPSYLGVYGDYEEASAWGTDMAAYLSDMGFNLNLGINADISSSDHVSDFTFSTDPDQAGELLEGAMEGFSESDVTVSLAAFPSKHGMTIPESGLPTLDKDLDALMVGEYVSFQDGIDAGAQMIQLADVYNAAIAGDDTTPCSLSANTVSILRNDMQFTGVILSGDVADSDVQDACDGEAAVKALQAGVDLIYCTDDFTDMYDAVLNAVNSGEITAAQLDQAVGRILTQKLE